MRICIPETFGCRGAGLGNELFPWAKAFLASQALGARLLHPAWGLNQRNYHCDFGTSRLDWLLQRGIRFAMPTFQFDESAYLATGKDDYQQAVNEFAITEGLSGRRHFVFVTSGMWGGFQAICKARVFVLSELLKARRAVENFHATMGEVHTGNVLIAVHIRRGDFLNINADDDYCGRFNVALPLEWYLKTCESIKRGCGGKVQFLLLTDASQETVQPFIDAFEPLTTCHLRQTACSDLLLMAYADCIVCSVSSYSMWGAFLSNAPYIWFAPNLQNHAGRGSLWGHEVVQKGATGATALNLERYESFDATKEIIPGRGVPVSTSGVVPSALCDKLMLTVRERMIERDLIFFGVVKLPDITKP
jgi:hypothetical protein